MGDWPDDLLLGPGEAPSPNFPASPAQAPSLNDLRAAVAALPTDFAKALAALKAGKRVTRSGWNGAGMWLNLQVPDEHSKMRRPYIYMSPVDGGLVPWVASQTDLLADDWKVLD